MRLSWRGVCGLIAVLLIGLAPPAAQAQVVPDPRIVDTITADEDAVQLINLPSGRGSAAIVVSNYCSCTLAIEGRVGSIWEAIDGAPTIAADGVYSVSAAGLDGIRVRASAWSSGTTTIALRVSSAGGGAGGGVGSLSEPLEVEGSSLSSIATAVAAVETAITNLQNSLSPALEDQAPIDLSMSGTYEILPAEVGVAYHGPITFKVNGTVTVTGIVGTETTTPCDTGAETRFTVDLTIENAYWKSGFHVPAGFQGCLTLSADVVVKGTVEF